MAVCMILIASSLSFTEPMCQPPRQMIDTLTPVLPSGRMGRAVDDFSSLVAWPETANAAVPAIPAWRNSRRVLSILDIVLAPRARTVDRDLRIPCRSTAKPQPIFEDRRSHKRGRPVRLDRPARAL